MPVSSIYTFAAQRVLFRAYDIRGDRQLFSDTFVKALSTVFAEQFLAQQLTLGMPLNHAKPINPLTVVIGYDPRHGSLEIAKQLAKTFIDYNIKVVWLGLVTTPMMVYWANRYDGHGFIATASHSAKHINGIKWVINGECPSSDDIQQIYHQLKSPELKCAENKDTNCAENKDTAALLSHPNVTQLPSNQLITGYTSCIENAINRIALTPENTPSSNTFKYPFKIVIDCLNGATGKFAKYFFTHFAVDETQIIVLNDTPNGDFPKGNPDPTESHRLSELQDAILHHKADVGLAFDGDGDRLMVVDNQGNILAPDHLIYLLACVAIDGVTNTHHADLKTPLKPPSQNPATVIFDVKCSHHLPLLIKKINAVPQMSKTGSSIMRRALQNDDNKAIFAGELSGHFLFNDGFFILHDDAMYAAVRLVHWLSHQLVPDNVTSNLCNKFADSASNASNSLENSSANHVESNSANQASNSSVTTLSDIIAQLPHMVSTEDIYLSLDDYQTADINETPLLNELTNLRQKLRFCCASTSQKNIAKDTDAIIETDEQKEAQLLQSVPIQAATILQCDKFGLPKNSKLTCIDGIRLDFDTGFGVIRSSNTSNSLTVRFAGDTLADVLQVKRYFVGLCQLINRQLASQIDSIAI